MSFPAALTGRSRPWSGAEIVTVRGHTDAVVACAWSPDGRKVVSSSRDNTVKVWDVETGAEVSSYARKGACDCGCSPDGSRIFSSSLEGTIALWNAESEASLVTLTGHTGPVFGCAFSADGRRIVSAGRDLTLRVWDVVSGIGIMTMTGHREDVFDCAFSPDGTHIISASADGALRLWDVQSGAELATLDGHRGDVRACVFSPSGTRIVSAGEDETLKVWDVETCAEIGTLIGHAGPVSSCDYSPDGRYVVSASADRTLRIWDTNVMTEQANAAHEMGPMEACAYSPDGTRIASGHQGIERTLRLWDADTGAETASCARSHVRACAYSPDGSTVLSYSMIDRSQLWDAETGTQLASWVSGRSSHCAFSPDGQRIVSPEDNQTVSIRDAQTSTELLRWPAVEVAACVYSPDGSRILSYSHRRGESVLWDAETATQLASWINGLSSFGLLSERSSFSPDGQRIVSAEDDRTVRIRDAQTGTELLRWPAVEVAACIYSPDRAWIASIFDHFLEVRDAQTAKVVAGVPLPRELTCIAAHPWRLQFACGDLGGRLWRIQLKGPNMECAPIVVTATQRDGETAVRCPACWQEHAIHPNQLGRPITCSTPGCGLSLRFNSFVVGRAQAAELPKEPSPFSPAPDDDAKLGEAGALPDQVAEPPVAPYGPGEKMVRPSPPAPKRRGFHPLRGFWDRYRQAATLSEGVDSAQEALEASLAIRRIGEGTRLREEGALVDARACFEKALAGFRAAGSRPGEAMALEWLAVIYQDLGMRREAVEHFRAARTISKELRNTQPAREDIR